MDNFIQWLKNHAGVVLVVVIGLVIGLVFLKKPAPTTSSTSTAGTSGLQSDANGSAIVYRDVADEFVNVNQSYGNQTYSGEFHDSPIINHNPTQPGPSAPPGTPASPSSPGEHPIEPGTTYPTDPVPYAGLLGSNVAVDFTKRTYKNAQGQDTPLPIPASDSLIQGSQNRVWYVDSGIQHLLTDGVGAPVTNSGYPVNSPQNTSVASGPVQQTTNSTQTTSIVPGTTKTTIGGQS